MCIKIIIQDLEPCGLLLILWHLWDPCYDPPPNRYLSGRDISEIDSLSCKSGILGTDKNVGPALMPTDGRKNKLLDSLLTRTLTLTRNMTPNNKPSQTL